MLQHVTLEVRPDQVRDCVGFWELLGFAELEPPELLRGRFIWVGRGGTQIHLQPVEDPSRNAGTRRSSPRTLRPR
jgi:hypothetical protein